MRIIAVNELKEVVNATRMTIVKVFDIRDPVYDIHDEYNSISKMTQYQHAIFASLALSNDDENKTAVQQGLFRLDGFPAFVVYCDGRSVAAYTGISNTTLKVMMDRYL